MVFCINCIVPVLSYCVLRCWLAGCLVVHHLRLRIIFPVENLGNQGHVSWDHKTRPRDLSRNYNVENLQIKGQATLFHYPRHSPVLWTSQPVPLFFADDAKQNKNSASCVYLYEMTLWRFYALWANKQQLSSEITSPPSSSSHRNANFNEYVLANNHKVATTSSH